MLGPIYGPSLGACTVCCKGSLWNEGSEIISTADVVSGPPPLMVRAPQG